MSNALGAAITSFIGQNLGAGRRDRVKLCVRQGMILAGVITVFLSAFILLLGRPLLHILTEDGAVIDTTFEIMTYFVPFYFVWAVIEVLSAVLRGAGDAVRPVVIIGLGICLLRVVTGQGPLSSSSPCATWPPGWSPPSPWPSTTARGAG